jgi:hypothetical protein
LVRRKGAKPLRIDAFCWLKSMFTHSRSVASFRMVERRQAD